MFINGTDFWCPPYIPMIQVLTEGECGPFRVEKFSVSEDQAKMFNIRATRNDMIYPGEYMKLVNGGIIMSDTPYERRTNYEFMRRAHGRVLIGGLGLGMIVVPLLFQENILQVTVVEKSLDVIQLIQPMLAAYCKDAMNKLRIVGADIFEFETKEMFDTIYFDIWPDVCGDNYPEMKKLHRKFARRVDRTDSRYCLESWERGWCRKAHRSGW